MRYLIHKRVFNILRHSAAKLTVRLSDGGAEALGLRPGTHIVLNIANPGEPGFFPPMNLVLDEEGFEADLKLFDQPRRPCRILWSAVVAAEPLPRPDGGGSKLLAAA